MSWIERPRVGQTIELVDGSEVEVISVRRANDVLRTMKELEAQAFGARMRATYGMKWREVYFEADVTLKNGRMGTVTPRQVKSVVSSP